MTFPHRLKYCFAAALLFLSVWACGALPSPEKLQSQLAAATKEKYPNADTVTVYDGSFVTYQPNGLFNSKAVMCVKILTEAGRKNLRSLSFHFDSDYGAYSAPAATIVKPDGSRIGIDAEKNTSVAISTRSMGDRIYSQSAKVMTLVIPQLEIGDAILLTLEYKSVKTPFPGIFSEQFGFQDDSPLIFAEVEIDAPESLPLRSVAVKSPVEGTVRDHGEKRGNGRIVYRWTAENVPQLIPEPDMPPLRGVAQRLLVSTAKDWQEISRWYYQLCRPRLDAVDDALKAEVAKIISGKKTDRDKAMALFQFVSQKIRYTGVDGEDRAPGFEPHDVRDTLRQRHGVCRDKAGLLVAMLELAGLKAYPVLFYASKSTVDDEVPASHFNHAVVAWETAPGQYQLMDPTCESTKEFFPAYLANQSYIVARPDGDVLRRSPSPPPEDNFLSVTTVASFDRHGMMKGESSFEFGGYNELIYRSGLSRRGRDVMRQIFARRLQFAVPGAEITDFRVYPENVRDMSRPLKIVMVYSAPGTAEVSGTMTLPMPELASRFGVFPYLLDNISLDTRRHPLRMECTAVAREKITLRLPETGRIIDLPSEATHEAPGARWTRKFAASGNTVSCESSLTFDSLEISAEKYPQLREFRRRRGASLSALPIIRTHYSDIPTAQLAKSFPDADSFLEDEKVTVDMTADGAVRIARNRRRRILTYAGVKDCSELRIEYTPKYEEVTVTASVTSPDGKKHMLPPEHVIDMDASWVASAPRYPKARIRVAVLPGVEIGSVVETTTVFKTKPDGLFGLAMPMFNHTPAARRSFTVNVSGPREYRTSPAPAVAESSQIKQGGTRIGTCRMTDTPMIPKELSQADLKLFVPTMHFSLGNYADYASALDKKLRELAAVPSPAADRMFAEISQQHGSKADTVRHIRDAVAKKLRSAGPDLSDMRFADLTPPERTLNDGYGNSADRAAVIAALLDRAGIKYEFVAVSDLPYIQENAKSLRDYPRAVFDDVLVYIPELDTYLNDTDQYAVPGSTGHASQIGLNLKSGHMIAIRPKYKADDSTTTTFDIDISENGAAEIAVTKEFCGTLFNREKRRFAEMTPEEQRQYYEIMSAGILPDAKLEKTKCDFSQYPGKIEFKFKIADFARSFGGNLMFELPGYDAMLGAINAVESARRTPAMRNQGVRMIIKYRIKIPQGRRMVRNRPAQLELGRRSSSYFSEHSDVMRDRIAIDARLVLPVELIQPYDYVELVNLQRDISRHFFRRIVLENVRR